MSSSSAGGSELATLQRWMLSVIAHPQGVESGIDSPEAQREISVEVGALESVIGRSQANSSFERIQVYANAYYARLVECLASEYPALKAAVGEEAFAGFAFEYLQKYPSRSYTLNDLGNQFPEFLAETRPEREPSQTGPDWADFLVDLATLERLYSDVFDGAGEEHLPKLDVGALQQVNPEDWQELTFRMAPSLRLQHLQFPVQQYISDVRHGRDAKFPTPAPIWLAVNRRDFVVRRRPVSRPQFLILERLLQQQSLGEAITAAMELEEISLQQLASQLTEWFQEWTREGLFLDFSLAASE